MNNKDEIINNAHKYALKGQIDDAIKEYLKILPHSKDGNILNTIGDLYLKNGENEAAIKYYKDAADMFNNDDSQSKTIALYHKILTLDPEQHNVVIALAALNAERGFTKQAVEDLIKTAEAYKSIGLPVKAINTYKKAINIVPSDMDLKIRMADLQVETNHINTALKMYMAIASSYEKKAESVKAEKMYKKIIALDPENVRSLIHLSRLAEDDQNLELAFEYISKAAELAPDNNEVKFDYDNLASKINRDISDNQEISQDVQNNNQGSIEIPDSMNEHNKTEPSHEPLELSSENNTIERSQVAKPELTPTPSMHIESTGTGYAEINRTYSFDNQEISGEQKEIHDESLHEEQASPEIYDPIKGNTLRELNQHAPVAAELDLKTAESELNIAPEEPARYTSEKDIRRLKKRVKTNWTHVLLTLCFISVTAISFFITFNYMKDTQTVDIETPEPVMLQDIYIRDEEDATDTSEKQNRFNELYTGEDEPIHMPSVQTGRDPEIINQEEPTFPGRESEINDNNDEFTINKTIDITTEQQRSRYPGNAEVETEEVPMSDTEPVYDTEDSEVIDQELLTPPMRKLETPGTESEIRNDTTVNTTPDQNSGYFDSTEIETEAVPMSDTEPVYDAEEIQAIDQGKLTLPVRESETIDQEDPDFSD